MTATLGTAPSPRVASVSLHMAGLALLFTSAGMAVCALVDVAMGGGDMVALAGSSLVVAMVGVGAWRSSRVPDHLRPKQVFAAVSWSWAAMSVAGAVPFLAAGLFGRLDDALFESISGFTCTGSTVMTGEDFATAGPGVLFWRQMTQWFGGMGIIVLAVAVLPFLGVGGLELIKAEAPGPTSDRLAPRVSETAKRLWIVYLGFTVASTLALMVVGLSLYDASAHALALVSTGGFSPNASSIGAYDSVAVELVVVAGMVIGGASFTLHWQALQGRLSAYWRSSELRLYLLGMAVSTVAVALLLVDDGNTVGEATRAALFNVVTLATSCGFGNATQAGALGDFVLWVPAAQVILFAFMWSGGMTGSTSGGIKVLRVQVMGRLAWRELVRARRPRALRPIKQGHEAVAEDVVSRIAGFVLLYFLLAVAATLVLTFFGTDLATAFSGAVGSMGNMGPALGEAGPTSSFLVFSRPERMLLALLMIVGRLEVFPMVLAVVAAGQRLGRVRFPLGDGHRR